MSTVKNATTKLGWAREQVALDSSQSYKIFCEKWHAEGNQGSAPAMTAFYKAKRELAAKTNGTVSPIPVSKIVHARHAKRHKGSRPVAFKHNGKPDKRFKENKDEVNAEEGIRSPQSYYEDIELRLEDLIVAAESLRNSELADTIRRARRLASKELLK